MGGVFFKTTSSSSSVDMFASSPSCPRLDPVACTGQIRRIKGQGAHGAGVGTACLCALVGSRANLCLLLRRGLPRCASRRRQLPAGGEGLCFRLCRSSRLRKQRRGQCGQQHEDKVRRAAGSARLTLSVAFLRIRRACSGVMPSSSRCCGVIAST